MANKKLTVKIKKKVGRKKGIHAYVPTPSPKEDLNAEAAKRLHDNIIFEGELLKVFGIRNSDLEKLRYFRELPYINITKTFRVYLYDGVLKWLENNQIKLGLNIPEEES